MRKIAIVAAILVLMGLEGVSHASDWALVGRVDVVGSVMGIREERVIVVEKQAPRRRIWVPEYRMVECGGHWEYESDRGRDICYRDTRHR
jgi:frataxin-like iron-binding protein CyaY